MPLLVFAWGPAAAAEAPPPSASQPPPPALSGGPSFAFTAYLWASALNGRSATLPPLPPADIDLSFGHILGHLDGAIMGAGEMRIGRWGLLTDLMYSQVTAGGDLPGPFLSAVEVRSRSLTLQGSALYRLYAGQGVRFDVGAGLRYWNLDNELTIEAGPLNRRLGHGEAEDWVDPVVATRLSADISGPWSVTFAGDIGGFDVGSKLTWQVLGTVDYRWSDALSLRAGYRVMSVDYDKDGFLYDVRMHGPILGATYRF